MPLTETTLMPAAAALDTRELQAWRGFLRAHAALTKALDAELEARHGLPLTSYDVLITVESAEDDRVRMCDLASSVLLSRSGLTRLVDRLERDGLIARESCTADARGQFAVLTDNGRAKLAEARATHLAGVHSLFLSHFNAEEQDLLAAAWARVLPGAEAASRAGCCSS